MLLEIPSQVNGHPFLSPDELLECFLQDHDVKVGLSLLGCIFFIFKTDLSALRDLPFIVAIWRDSLQFAWQRLLHLTLLFFVHLLTLHCDLSPD